MGQADLPARKREGRPFLLLVVLVAAAVAAAWLALDRGWNWSGLKRAFLPPRSCGIGDVAACPPEEFCAARTEPRAGHRLEGVCVRRYVGPKPLMQFPFAPDHPVVCVQGPGTTPRDGLTHVTAGSAYAVDLRTADPEAHAGTVYAAVDGTAIIHQRCSRRRKENPEDAQDPAGRWCGEGLGNHVRILRPDGTLVLYAHLDSIWIRDSQVVKRGDPIGTEGRTGNAPDRRLHFSVHFAPPDQPWLQILSRFRAEPAAVPASIPFELQYCDPRKRNECARVRSQVTELPCADAPGGSLPIRGDWRT